MDAKSSTRTATLTVGNKTYDFPILGGTIGPEVVDIAKLYAQSGMFTYDPGFTSTASCQSKSTYIDGDAGVLEYRGYPIEQPMCPERTPGGNGAPDTIRTCDLCLRKAGLFERRAPPHNLRPISRGALLVSVQRVFLLYGHRILDQSFGALNAPQTSCYFEIDGSSDQFDGANSSPDPVGSFCNVHEHRGAHGYQPRVFDSQRDSGLDP